MQRLPVSCMLWIYSRHTHACVCVAGLAPRCWLWFPLWMERSFSSRPRYSAPFELHFCLVHACARSRCDCRLERCMFACLHAHAACAHAARTLVRPHMQRKRGRMCWLWHGAFCGLWLCRLSVGCQRTARIFMTMTAILRPSGLSRSRFRLLAGFPPPSRPPALPPSRQRGREGYEGRAEPPSLALVRLRSLSFSHSYVRPLCVC